MRVGKTRELSGVQDKNAQAVLEALLKCANGNVELESNIPVQLLKNCYFKVGTTTYAFGHKFGTVPRGFIVISQTTFAKFRKAPADWTTTAVFLQADTAETFADILIIK